MSSTATTPAISFDTIVEMHILVNDLTENTPVITDDQLFREDVTSAIEAKIREANWPSTITLEVPKDHPSGTRTCRSSCTSPSPTTTARPTASPLS